MRLESGDPKKDSNPVPYVKRNSNYGSHVPLNGALHIVNSNLSIVVRQKTYPTKAKLAKTSDAKRRVLASTATPRLGQSGVTKVTGPPGCGTVISSLGLYFDKEIVPKDGKYEK